jgi:hypothetical protein
MESMIKVDENPVAKNSEVDEATVVKSAEGDEATAEDTSKEFIAMRILSGAELAMTKAAIAAGHRINRLRKFDLVAKVKDERGDVPGWVLVVLMTTGLVTAIWTIAAPRLTTILKNSLDAMNGIR